MLSRSEFKFRKHESIGSEGAEEDKEYLYKCFVDTGDLDVLRNTKHPARIVEGRTGAGKTALLMVLENNEENVKFIEPEELALQFISNSNVIRYLESNGVNLNIFYKLLWRHILTIELIKIKYDIKNKGDQAGFITRMYEKYFGDQKKKEAYEYLTEWGEKFWVNTEERVKQVTQKLENQLIAELSSKIPSFSSKISGSAKFNHEEVAEIVKRAQEIVNSVQIRKLSKIIDTLAEDEFCDDQQRYYIVMDKLDENWVDEDVRYKLVRALVETIRDLKRIESTKIIISIRRDLIDSVFRHTRDVGFQEEKYQSLFLRVYWKKTELMELVDKRLNFLIQRQYTGKKVTWRDIFPAKIGDIPTDDYLTLRTMFRPRDIISFVNGCIDNSTGFAKITATRVRDAESHYSDVRYRALGDEWIADYPNLLRVLKVLKNKPKYFHFNEISKSDLDDLVMDVLSCDVKENCLVEDLCHKYFHIHISYDDALIGLLKIFYKVGVLGVREHSRGVSWCFKDDHMIHDSQITGKEGVEICPMFYRVFGIG